MATTLRLEGMTCAGCAARIERALNDVPGADAVVNFATEQAVVEGDLPVEELVAAVAAAGYGAAPADGLVERRAPGLPLAGAAALSIPVVVLAMSGGGWAWGGLVLRGPGGLWG